MIERRGDLWEQRGIKVITTNGTVKKNEEAVMGRGCAFQAMQRHPGLSKRLGRQLCKNGNHVHRLRNDLTSFPVKHNWWEKADIVLIRRSALELVEMADAEGWDEITIPRPGCGNGGLLWDDVKPVIEKILDDRFYVITYGDKIW